MPNDLNFSAEIHVSNTELGPQNGVCCETNKIVSISRMINKRPDNTSNSLEDALIDGRIWADIIRVPGTTLMDAHHNRIVVSNMRLIDQL